jgi:hypothetical protein
MTDPSQRVTSVVWFCALQVDFLGAFKSPGVQAASDPSAVGRIVGTTVGAVTTLALGSVLGPFASPLGASAGVLATKAWDLSKELLLKYKADYSAKSQDKASIKMSGTSGLPVPVLTTVSWSVPDALCSPTEPARHQSTDRLHLMDHLWHLPGSNGCI